MAFVFASWAVSLHNYLWGNKSQHKCVCLQIHHIVFQLVDQIGGSLANSVVRFVSECMEMNYIQV